MRLKNKVALVTGGSQGIGEAICLRFAREGARVAVVNARSPGRGRAVAARIRKASGAAAAYACNVSEKARVKSLVRRVLRDFGTIDILVNSAGIMINKPIERYTETDWDRTMAVNLKGTFLMCQAVVPHMKKRGWGRIINVSSTSATHAFPDAVAYCASKGGVHMITRALASEVARFGINVNALSPGNTATPLNRHLQDDAEFVRFLEDRTPSGRAYISAEEIAGAAVFLASDDAGAVHGHDLIVDDGWCAM